MRLSFTSSVLLLASIAQAASWTFSDGSVTIASKKSEDKTSKFTDKQKSDNRLSLGAGETLKVSVTLQDGSKAKRPHQAFLVLKEANGLEAPYALSVKESGKGSVEIAQRDLPAQLLQSADRLEASLVIGSFTSTTPSIIPVFDVAVEREMGAPAAKAAKPLRYGQLDEIHHIYRTPDKSPAMIICAVFCLVVVAALPTLLASWTYFNGNLSHLSKALSASPISHAVLFGSIVAMEGVFFLYYSSWNLFQALPAATVVGVVAFLGGRGALTEVKNRRLAGER